MKRKLLISILVVISCIFCTFGIAACNGDKPNGDGQGTIQTPPEEKPDDTEKPSVAEVTGVALNKTAFSLEAGDYETLTAIVSPNNAANKPVTWKSSDSSVAKVENGKVTALKAGTATITATVGGKSATCKVTVTEKVIAVTGVTLSKTTLSLEEGENETLTATVSPNNATRKTVNWKSSDGSVAKVENGKITALNAGTATITATAGGKSATCKVTVTDKVIAVTGVTLSKTTLSLEVGDNETLTATVSPNNATDKTIIWKSSDNIVAKVENGKITALNAGTATITATAGVKSATCKVTVTEKAVAVTGVTLNKTTLSLEIGDNETLTATVAPSNATNKTVTWKSSDNIVAKVENGKITALNAGSATITVTAGGKSATCNVKVTEKVIAVTSVILNKTTLSLEVDGVETLTATVAPNNATDKTVNWKSSDNSVAKVENGKITAIKAGSATITATAGSKSVVCQVTVNNKSVVITWKNFDNTVLKIDYIDYNTIPSYSGDTPFRESDAKYEYSFCGWTPMISTAIKDETYIASYNESLYDTYTVRYDANGGESAPMAQTKGQGDSIKLSSIIPSRQGYQFVGWNNIYENTVYQSGDIFSVDINITLFAMWEENCIACNGAGIYVQDKKSCSVCAGRGTTSETTWSNCSGCHGAGSLSYTVACSTCQGAGGNILCQCSCGNTWWMVNTLGGSATGSRRCSRCGKTVTGQLYGTCSTCSGSGTIQTSKKCSSCNGSGGSYNSYNKKCTSCNGQGYTYNTVTCSDCSGSKILKKDAPTPLTIKERSIELTNIEGYEYSMDGEVWQSDNKFNNLQPSTEYYFYQRLATNGEIPFGTTSAPLKVTTKSSITFLIKYELDGGTNNADNPDFYTLADENIVLLTPTKENHYFVGWEYDSAFINEIDVSLQKDITLRAVWTSTRISFNKTELTLSVGEVENLIITFYPSDVDYVVRWESSDNLVAEVIDGKISALKEGTATITAICGDDRITCIVYVLISKLNFTYNNGTATVTQQSNDLKGDVIIPTKVKYNNQEYIVNSIAASAFADCEYITSITIPENITTIGYSAFNNCSSLKTVYWNATACISAGSNTNRIFNGCDSFTDLIIGDNVTKIPDFTFRYCGKLKNVTFGKSLASIGDAAFGDCSSIVSLTIPISLTFIDTYAFAACGSLTEINYGGTKQQWKDIVKGSYWNSNTGNYTVHCTDGDIAKS